MKILYDKDLNKIDYQKCHDALLSFLKSDAMGKYEKRIRHHETFEQDQLSFTSGFTDNCFGFRAYSFRAGLARKHQDQIVALWDRKSHTLKAIALGEMLGAWRTGMLGGIAQKILAPKHITVCGVIGSGLQAYTQIKSVIHLCKPNKIAIYSPTLEKRDEFINHLITEENINIIACDSAQDVAQMSTSLIVATRACSPVIQTDWLTNCKHISTIGPKSHKCHELPRNITKWASVIASDSPRQIKSQGTDHFLQNHHRIKHLGDLANTTKQSFRDYPTLYLSSGLSGSEVALLNAIISTQ